MPILQAVVPQEIFDAVEREAEARKPKTSMSKIVAEVVIPAFEERAARLRQKRTLSIDQPLSPASGQ